MAQGGAGDSLDPDGGIEGLEAELDAALTRLWRMGDRDWVRRNYPEPAKRMEGEG